MRCFSWFNNCLYFSLVLQPPWALAFDFYFHGYFTDGRTPCTSDELVARFLPKHRTTQTQNEHIHIPNIHTLCGIRIYDPGFRASEDSTCLRPLGYRDWQEVLIREDTSWNQIFREKWKILSYQRWMHVEWDKSRLPEPFRPHLVIVPG
jgi:hypothetical protein